LWAEAVSGQTSKAYISARKERQPTINDRCLDQTSMRRAGQRSMTLGIKISTCQEIIIWCSVVILGVRFHQRPQTKSTYLRSRKIWSNTVL
jgi:hypothetical protein